MCLRSCKCGGNAVYDNYIMFFMGKMIGMTFVYCDKCGKHTGHNWISENAIKEWEEINKC